jgi:hypothetical protein
LCRTISFADWVGIVPKAKPVSLHPLTFHEGVKALINVDPDRIGITPKRRQRIATTKSKDH